MTQTDGAGTGRGGVAVWLFRVLIIAAAALMLVSWFTPWWAAKIAILPGEDHMVMHPWGVEAVAQVRANADESLYSMPWIFAPFMWTYLTVCMLALAASLFVTRQVNLGRFKISLATLLILLVGLTYLIAVGLAYEIGQLKAGWAGSNFIGRSAIKNAMSGANIRMDSALKDGFWLALYAGPVFILLALLRRFFVGKPRA